MDVRAVLPPGQDSPYRGNYASLPVVTLKPPSEGNRTVPVVILWTRDGVSPSYTIHFNARAQQVVSLSQIAALHIDNTQCSSTINIVFPDTQFQLQLGPNSEGFYPVVTNSLEFYAYIDLAPTINDRSVIQVLNFLPPPIEFGSAGGQGVGAGTVRQVDTVAPLQGGPITDQGTLSLAVPLPLNIGGTGAITANAALDNLSATSGTTAGSLSRSAGGNWTVAAGAGSGTISAVNPGTGLTGGGTSGAVTVGLQVPVTVANGGTGATTAGQALTNLAAAPLFAPAFTGAPTAATAAPGTNTTQLASTAFVQAAVATAGGAFAPLESPVFTGDPKAPTPATSDNDTSIATTAYVKSQAYVTGGPYLATAGGSLSGALTLAADPAVPLAAATKQYVDNKAFLPLAGGVLSGGLTVNGLLTVNANISISGGYVAPNSNGYFGTDTGGAPRTIIQMGSDNNVYISDGTRTTYLQDQVRASSDIILPVNNKYLYGAEPGGTLRQLAGVNINGQLTYGYGNYYLLIAPGSSNYHKNVRHDFQDTTGATLAAFVGAGTYNQSGAWVALSDAALKENVEPYNAGGLAAITALRPVSFTYKEGTPFADDNKTRRYGFIAQEVEPVLPEFVGEEEFDGVGKVKTLSPGLLIYPLINAVRELAAQVAELQAAAQARGVQQ